MLCGVERCPARAEEMMTAVVWRASAAEEGLAERTTDGMGFEAMHGGCA